MLLLSVIFLFFQSFIWYQGGTTVLRRYDRVTKLNIPLHHRARVLDKGLQHLQEPDTAGFTIAIATDSLPSSVPTILWTAMNPFLRLMGWLKKQLISCSSSPCIAMIQLFRVTEELQKTGSCSKFNIWHLMLLFYVNNSDTFRYPILACEKFCFFNCHAGDVTCRCKVYPWLVVVWMSLYLRYLRLFKQ